MQFPLRMDFGNLNKIFLNEAAIFPLKVVLRHELFT